VHETILALLDGRSNPDRTRLLGQTGVLELHHALFFRPTCPLDCDRPRPKSM
jgi:hypothetical protein